MSDAPQPEMLSKTLHRMAWAELTDSQKIERMHEVVKQQGREIDRLRDELYKLRHHQHKDNGDMLIPYSHTSGSEQKEAMARPDAGPWF